MEPIPTKYAYIPLGYSGVLPYLPLCWSKSPALVKLKSSIKNPLLNWCGLLTTLLGFKTYPEVNILTAEFSSVESL